jgi:hypothetical protein
LTSSASGAAGGAEVVARYTTNLRQCPSMRCARSHAAQLHSVQCRR